MDIVIDAPIVRLIPRGGEKCESIQLVQDRSVLFAERKKADSLGQRTAPCRRRFGAVAVFLAMVAADWLDIFGLQQVAAGRDRRQ